MYYVILSHEEDTIPFKIDFYFLFLCKGYNNTINMHIICISVQSLYTILGMRLKWQAIVCIIGMDNDNDNFYS